MEHPVVSTRSLRSPAQDNEPPSIAFGTSTARLHERSHGLAIATALVAGVLGALALLGKHSAPPVAAAAPCIADTPEDLQAGCEQGDVIACNNLGVTYQHGYSVTPDAARAFRAFDQACSGGSADGCSNLGALYERGQGAQRDLAQALRLYDQACSAGAALGCSNLGALYARGLGTARDRSEAQRLFTFACEHGSASGCANLMQLPVR